MQRITKLFISICLISIPRVGFSRSKVNLPANQLMLTIYIPGKYTKQISQIYKTKNELVCKTELEPYFPILRKNEEAEVLKLKEEFIKESNTSQKSVHCSEKIEIKHGEKNFSLCSSNQTAQKLVKRLSSDCGRS